MFPLDIYATKTILWKNSQVITGTICIPSIGHEAVVVFVDRNDNDDHKHWDPPAHKWELQHVVWYVAVEDLHYSHVHVEPLQPHPGEDHQQEVVKKPGGGDAKAHSIRIKGQPRVH